jgi:coenzyme F420 biosynthesis associated uncharacterized protein
MRMFRLMNDVVDWNLATRVGSRWAPDGPNLSLDEAKGVVSELRALAREAVAPVAEVTGLSAGDAAPAHVVDRNAWIASNVRAMRVSTQILLEEHTEGGALLRNLGAQTSALQVGGALAWLSGKVLGQYEVFTDPGEERRLLLVAPTIVAVQRQLDVPQRDFQLWVCLHEETHRVQFTAVNWLAGYLTDQVGEFLDVSDMDFIESLRRVFAVLSTGVAAIRGKPASLVEAIQSPEQKVVFDRLTALMSLLEGHADVVMDEVGPQVVPSVGLIRERFTARRASPKAGEAFMRRAIGMDAKLRQYSEGAAFVRAIIDARGMTGFNAIWASPKMLPTRAEITEPSRWLART